MFLEVIDVLRCTARHEDHPLVASIQTRAGRDIIAGTLGCPACGAEYPIENGLAIFGTGLPRVADRPVERYAETDEEIAMRCAAMLGLFDPGGIVVLGGAWGRAASALLEMTRASLLLVEGPAGTRLGVGISGIRIGTTLPLAPASVRGIALDDHTSTTSLIESAVRALKPGGHLIAAAALAVPPGIVERARDDRHWVGESQAMASAPVQLTKGRLR